MKNRHIVYTLLALGAAVAIIIWATGQGSAVNPDQEATTSPELVIGYFSRAIGYAPYYVARHHGWFENHSSLADWTITHRFYNDRATISDSFDSGELDVLLSAEIPAIMSRAQGNDIRIVAVTGLIRLQWLGQSQYGPQSIADFRGRTVAYQSGTSSHYGLLTTLERSGLVDTDINLRNMRAVEAQTAFESGDVDGWVVWSPFFEQQIVGGSGIPVSNSNYEYATTMAVAMPLLRESPAAVDALVEILDRGKAWIQENPAPADSMVAAATLQTVPVAHLALSNVSFDVSLTDELVDTFQDMAQFLADNGATRRNTVVDVRQDLVFELQDR